MTEPVAVPPGRPVAREAVFAVALLAGGAALGGIWTAAGPALARAADDGEARVAVDGTLALLQLAAGLVTAVVLVIVPGARPAVRFAVGVVAACGAGLLSWGVGHLGGLSLGAPGVALLWPLTFAVLTALRALGGTLLSRA